MGMIRHPLRMQLNRTRPASIDARHKALILILVSAALTLLSLRPAHADPSAPAIPGVVTAPTCSERGTRLCPPIAPPSSEPSPSPIPTPTSQGAGGGRKTDRSRAAIPSPLAAAAPVLKDGGSAPSQAPVTSPPRVPGESFPWSRIGLTAVILAAGVGLHAWRRGRARGEETILLPEAAAVTESREDFDRLTKDFLSNLSHELRTPLTPVKGYAQMLAGGGVSKEKAHTYATAIVDASDRLERVFDVLVGVAQLDAGRIRKDGAPVELPALVAETTERWRARYPQRLFRCAIDGGPAVVSADRRLLSLALDQLIDNAAKFSPETAEILIDLRRGDEGFEIAVTDHGLGVARPDRSAIFGDFRQLDGSSTRARGGLGLGLSLVRRVAEVHGGTISVESIPDRGSTFTLALPLVQPVGRDLVGAGVT